MAFDVMAFNEDMLETMGNAIDKYVDNLTSMIGKIGESYINGVSAKEAGFYGTGQVETVNAYITNTCTQIKNIVLYFNEFREKLSEVQRAYDARQASITTGDVEAAPTNEGDLVNVKPFN